MKNNEKNENLHSVAKVRKVKKLIKSKNSEDKNNFQIKNSIFNKVITKSNSIIQNNYDEHYSLNYKNKMSIKNSPLLPKSINQAKNKNQLKSKIKTTFSSYYTDLIFKTHNKQNFNVTDVNYGGEDTEELSRIQFNIETNEDSLQTNGLKNSGLYNTDSSQKIIFNTCINNSHNNSKDNSLYNNKGSILVSPKQSKMKENTKILNNSYKKIQNIRGQNSENKNKLNKISNKNLKILGNKLFKKNKNLIKAKKINENIKNVKIEDIDKENRKIIFEIKNKTEKKSNKKYDKHIYLSPMQKNIKNIFVKMKSSSKKVNNHSKYLSHYNTSNNVSNKEKEKNIFNKKNNYVKQTKKNSNNNLEKFKDKNKIKNNYLNSKSKDIKFTKLNINTQANAPSLKDKSEIMNYETDIYKIMNENNEVTPTVMSEDKSTEKDLYLEYSNTLEKNDKNLIDYFKTARKAVKSMSHSLVDTNTANKIINRQKNLFVEKGNEFFKKDNKKEQNKKKKDSNHKYTIKKVPIFSGVNMFPQKNVLQITDNYITNIFCKANKENNKLNQFILNFLDDKSIICLSYINKEFYKHIRQVFYIRIFNKICKNKDNIFITKINDSLIDLVSNKLSKKKAQLESIYSSLPTKTSYKDLILNDLSRTFPNDLRFKKDSVYYNKLYNILTKYSNYNPIIGYAQGLNFLFANAIYLYDNEKNSFFYIDGLIRKFNLEDYYAEKNPKLAAEINKFAKILNKYIPDIINYFNAKLLNHDFFTTDWILTLFGNSMNSDNLFICWNFMIIFGWKFFYCFVIQILVFYQSIIFSTNENGLSQLMKNLLKEEKFSRNLPIIIEKALMFMQKNIIL